MTRLVKGLVCLPKSMLLKILSLAGCLQSKPSALDGKDHGEALVRRERRVAYGSEVRNYMATSVILLPFKASTANIMSSQP